MGEKGSSSSTGMDFTLLRWACWVLSHCGGVFEVGGLVGGYVGRELGWFGGEKGFGVVSIGSISTEQKASQSESYKITNEWSKFGTSSEWEELWEGVIGAGGGAVTIAAAAAVDWHGTWWRLSGGQKGKLAMGFAMAGWVPCHFGWGFLLYQVRKAWKTKASSFSGVGAWGTPVGKGGGGLPVAKGAVMVVRGARG